jgi:small subunit ribosomal protein S5
MADKEINTQSTSANQARHGSSRPPFNRGKQGGNSFSKGRGGQAFGIKRNRERRKVEEPENKYDSHIIQVRRVTRVVKGGKRMRFSALVVVGDKKGNVGYGLRKGVDFQESVSKATKQATANLVKVSLNENDSVSFQSQVKYKSSIIMLKPADQGTGLISGGFIRPVLELAGIKNVYSKIIGSNNKVTGVQAVFEAFKKYSTK